MGAKRVMPVGHNGFGNCTPDSVARQKEKTPKNENTDRIQQNAKGTVLGLMLMLAMIMIVVMMQDSVYGKPQKSTDQQTAQ
jgi:hypothetical protein